MAVTAANLIDAIRYILDEQGLAVGGLIGDLTSYATAGAEAKKIMNWGYADVLRRLPRRNTEQGISTDTVSTVADTEAIALTDLNIQWVRDVEGGWSETDAKKRYRIHIIDRPIRVYHYDSGSGLDTPRNTCWFDFSVDPITINILPIPTSTKANEIKIWYWKKGYNLLTASDSAITPFLEEYEELIAFCGAQRALAKKGRSLTQMQVQLKMELEEQLDNNLARFTRQRPKHSIYRGAQGFD